MSIGVEGAKELAKELKKLINMNSLTINLEQKQRSFANALIINSEKNKTKKFLIKSFAENIFFNNKNLVKIKQELKALKDQDKD